MRPNTREDVVFRRIGDEFAILDPGGEVVHVLNPSAAAIWVLCDGSRDVDAITEEVSEVFDLDDPQGVRADVLDAVDTFQTKGLLR